MQTHYDNLHSNMAEAIAQIKAVEKSFPGAVIIHHINDGSVVYMNKWGIDHLDTTLEELQQLGTDYYPKFFNAEDAKDYVPKILGLLERNNDDEFISHFQQVRRSPQHDWHWYLTSTKIFYRNAAGHPLLTLTVSLPVDAQHHIAAKAERLLAENSFLRSNHKVFNTLTKREKEILQLMAKGESSIKIANQLFLSETTVNTHRRNIKRKLNIETTYDITRFAQAFDLI